MATHANPGQHPLLGSKGTQFSPTFFSGQTVGELDGMADGETDGDSLGDEDGSVLLEGDFDTLGDPVGTSLGIVDGRSVPGIVGDAEGDLVGF